jgi:DNA-binding response OmpR family regulator
MKVLVVDDDLALADVVSFTLRRAGFEVVAAYDGLSALERWREEAPILVVLDLNLPKLDGLQVCRQIRAEGDTPIIMLSVRGEEDDIVRGLELGADDYIVKPFSPRQLVARAEAVLRRSGERASPQDAHRSGGLFLDSSRYEVYYQDQLVNRLTRLEFNLLETLLLNRGQVLPYDALIDHVWGPGGADKAMLKQLVYRLRRKLGILSSDLVNIETVSGIGYSLLLQNEPSG